MDRSEAKPLSEILQEFVQTNRLGYDIKKSRVPEVWKEVAGEYISNSTVQIYVSNNKLFVKIKSSLLRNEILLVKSELINRINEKLGKGFIEDIIVR